MKILFRLAVIAALALGPAACTSTSSTAPTTSTNSPNGTDRKLESGHSPGSAAMP